MKTPGLLPLDHPLWNDLEGGYREPSSAVEYLKRFENGERSDELWHDFVGEMYQQETIGVASLAVVPHLVEIFSDEDRPTDFYNYLTFVDAVRGDGDNPELPDWLRDSYESALCAATILAAVDLNRTEDKLTRKSIVLFVLQRAEFTEQMRLLDNIENEDHARAVLDNI